jgi:hypothetical protein
VTASSGKKKMGRDSIPSNNHRLTKKRSGTDGQLLARSGRFGYSEVVSRVTVFSYSARSPADFWHPLSVRCFAPAIKRRQRR